LILYCWRLATIVTNTGDILHPTSETCAYRPLASLRGLQYYMETNSYFMALFILTFWELNNS